MSRRFHLKESDFVIRTYEPWDGEQVWSLHMEGLRDTGALLPESQPAWDDDLRHVEEIYLGEGSHFWVVEQAGRIVGMTAVRRLGPETAELKRMRVTTDRRRMGIGQWLLNIAEEFCRRHAYKRIVLDTTDRQHAARCLYEKNGYILTSERPLGRLRLFYYRKDLD